MKNKPATMRSSFIRVTRENNTSEHGKITYSSNSIKNILNSWSSVDKYWFIFHDNKKDTSNPHYHIVVKYKNPTKFKYIKQNFPHGEIQRTKSIRASLLYLTHKNDDSKHQYDIEKVVTNDKDYLLRIYKNEPKYKRFSKILEDIENGTIREYNQFELIPLGSFVKYKHKIEKAHDYVRQRHFMDKGRKVDVFYIFGPTGTGKTTYVKDLAQKINKSLCISSSSNDPLQDYKGEDILCLDDMQKDAFSHSDFLKLLDNHTLSSTASRYVNKLFIGDRIYITSNSSLHDWYPKLSPNSRERKALYRRIKTMYHFNDDMEIYKYEIDEKTGQYIEVGIYENTVIDEYEKTKSPDDMKEFGMPIKESIPDDVVKAN